MCTIRAQSAPNNDVAYLMPGTNEALARIKINRLLEEAGWRFFDADGVRANIALEERAVIRSVTQSDLDALGEDFEQPARGFVDFLLLDSRQRPLIVLEAKSEQKDPLAAKEQARKYARAKGCRFVLLSNGNLHYFWDTERGHPHIVTRFPSPDSLVEYQRSAPNPRSLATEIVNKDYIAQTQRHGYQSEAGWTNEPEREAFVRTNKLRFLRPYQLRAIQQLQAAAKEGNDRYLFEMATGTGKTLTAAAVIKLFLRTGNARRVLFLVDRLELEEQAKKAFTEYLKEDYTTVVYKESRDDWRHAEIVVTTVQSLLFNNKYRRLFSPTDFDLIISDEAHRSIAGNARAVFEYFLGYKLGLTATPRDYLKNYTPNSATQHDPRESERRLLEDTYRTFGCKSGVPTFSYTLLDGVRDGYLISPTVVQVKTGITTQLLSDEGFAVTLTDEEGAEQEVAFGKSAYEKRFFADATNEAFCRAFLDKGLRDPVTGEFGKSIVFAVSQRHASRLANTFNILADKYFPGRYRSDFAMQVTSNVADAQEMTTKFANNNLGGSGAFDPDYRTSKTRICVTVGMMTTGYDCTDILNLGLFRPIFSPTDFVQIKGRGTRTCEFTDLLFDDARKAELGKQPKQTFKLFDYFENCTYFETEFNYDEKLELPSIARETRTTYGIDNGEDTGGAVVEEGYTHLGEDDITEIAENLIGAQGMKIDRMLFQRFEDAVRDDAEVVAAWNAGNVDRAAELVRKTHLDKPEEYFTLEKLRKAVAVDRRISMREILEKVFGVIARFKTKDELLEEEASNFIADQQITDPAASIAIKRFFKAYASDEQFRSVIDRKAYTELATSTFTLADLRAVPETMRREERVQNYIRDYVPLNQF